MPDTPTPPAPIPPPVDPSSGNHAALPAAPPVPSPAQVKVGTNWSLQDIFEWIIKGILGLAVWFIGAEYQDIKDDLKKAKDRIVVLEKQKVADEAKDVTKGLEDLESEVRAVSDRLIRIETTLGHVRARIDKPVRSGGGFLSPMPLPADGSPH